MKHDGRLSLVVFTITSQTREGYSANKSRTQDDFSCFSKKLFHSFFITLLHVQNHVEVACFSTINSLVGFGPVIMMTASLWSYLHHKQGKERVPTNPEPRTISLVLPRNPSTLLSRSFTCKTMLKWLALVPLILSSALAQSSVSNPTNSVFGKISLDW